MTPGAFKSRWESVTRKPTLSSECFASDGREAVRLCVCTKIGAGNWTGRAALSDRMRRHSSLRRTEPAGSTAPPAPYLRPTGALWSAPAACRGWFLSRANRRANSVLTWCQPCGEANVAGCITHLLSPAPARQMKSLLAIAAGSAASILMLNGSAIIITEATLDPQVTLTGA